MKAAPVGVVFAHGNDQHACGPRRGDVQVNDPPRRLENAVPRLEIAGQCAGVATSLDCPLCRLLAVMPI